MAIAENMYVKKCSNGTKAMVYVDLKDQEHLGKFAFENCCLNNPFHYGIRLKSYRLKGTKLDSCGNTVARYEVLCPKKNSCPFYAKMPSFKLASNPTSR